MKPIPAALAAPWAIEPNWLRVVFGVWSRGQLDAVALGKAKAEWDGRKSSRPRLDEIGAPVEGTGGSLRIVGNIGVISVEGPLFRHATLFSDISGGTSYDAIRSGLEAAVASRAVSSIMLRINSPGGEADGVSELSRFISEVDQNHKPVETHVSGMCASAALWIACGSRKITAEQTSEIGSIGVRVGLVDYSGNDEIHGIREIEVISSQSPGKRSKPLDDEVIGRIQTRIDDLADLFVAAVAEGRDVDPETVIEKFGGGDVMIASKALTVGLIDDIAAFDETLSAATAAPIGPRANAQRITMAIKNEKPTAGDGPEWQCSGCNEMMGPSAKSYCAKCAEDDGDEEDDEDEDDAKALGLDLKASAEARKMRKQALVDAEKRLCAATGKPKLEDALAVAEIALRDAPALRESAAKSAREAQRAELRGVLERGLAGAPGVAPRLSLGALQKEIPTLLRGDAKKAWVASMEKLAATADAAKSTIKAAAIIDAACAVDLSAEDVDAIKENVAARAPVAAVNHVEPMRNGAVEDADVAQLDDTAQIVAKAAATARAAFDRNNPTIAAK